MHSLGKIENVVFVGFCLLVTLRGRSAIR